MAEIPDSIELLSIGDVAEATGISPDTIRVWERRYGRPRPHRLTSGHRRYTRDQVRWLRRVAEALARGHRPSRAVRASEAELDAILAEDVEGKEAREAKALLDLVRAYARRELAGTLRSAWDKLGPDRFLSEFIGPLVTLVGREWSDGTLDVRHEHFLSEVLEDVLRSLRLTLSAEEDAPVVLFATLPDEKHGIGLQMATLFCAAKGANTRLLGVETPIEEMARAAREVGADAVAVSVSLATGGVETDRLLSELRKTLPDEIRLVIGGRGARGVRRGPRGVEYAEDFDELGRWYGKLRK